MAQFKNLTARAAVTVIGIPLAVFIIYQGDWLLFAFMVILSIMANDEFLRLQNFSSFFQRLFMHALQLSLTAAAFSYRFDLMIVILLTAFLWNSNTLLLRNLPNYMPVNNSGLAVLIYPGLALASVMLLREMPYHSNFNSDSIISIIYLLLAAIWICDSLAYFFGSAFGKTKLFPSVSPNKSWEGTIAGFLGALTLMLAAAKFNAVTEFIFADYIVLALISGGLGQLGDLVESKYKREIGVKDSANILPGHGGIWDRLDSIAMAVPATWIYLYLRFVIFS